MSLESNFIFLVIFGVVGFIIKKLYNFNPAEYWAKFGSISIGISLIIAFFPIIFNPDDITGNVGRLTNWLTNILPGTIIGDLAGQFVSEMTRRRR